MTDTLSNNAIVYAILALNSEISLQKDYLESSDVASEEKENEEGILADLEQALMEFIELYKIRLKRDKTLPPLEELMHSEL